MPEPGSRRAAGGDEYVAAAGPIYDSFVVKIWHDAGAVGWRRVEIQHVQTDLTEAVRDVEPEWLWRALLALVAGSGEPGPEGSPYPAQGP